MSIVAAIAVIGLSGGSPYPIAEVLSVAQHGCEVALTSEDPVQALGADGWAPVTPKPGSWVAAQLRDEAEFWGPKLTPSKVYARKAAGRILFAFISSAKLDEGDLKLCAVQDPEAQIDTGAQGVLAWAGRAPTNSDLLAPAMAQQMEKLHFTKAWKPGLHAGADDTAIRYLSPKDGGIGLVFSSERLVRKEAQ